MEDITQSCDTGLLIDLSSPQPKCHQTKSQLNILQVDSKINALPSVFPNTVLNINQISQFKDPFEEVFLNAYLNENKIKGNKECADPNNMKLESIKHNSKTLPKEGDICIIQATHEDIINKTAISSETAKPNIGNHKDSMKALHCSKTLIDNSFNHENVEQKKDVQETNISLKVSDKNFTKEYMKCEIAQINFENKEQDIDVNTVASNLIQTESTPTALVTNSDDINSCISGDFSTEEGLRAVIAKRVNHCIQSALNDSLKPKINLASAKTLNRRSLSFVSQSSKSVKCDRLNKSCEQFKLGNEEFISSENAMESSYIRPLSPSPGEVLNMEDSVFLTSDKDVVFKEANKLARTFSKLAASFCKMSDSDSEDDLLTCQPRWMYADSSEDEEEKLLRDPALNIRVSLTNSMSKSRTQPDSDALSSFKSRYRLNNSGEETTLKNSIPAPKSTKMAALPSIMTSVPLAKVKLDEHSTKLKRTNKGSKQIPLKATIPIQSMTKDCIQDEGKLRNPPSPPANRQNSESLLKTPSKDTSQTEMRPVASSTPNKSIIGSTNPLSTSAISVPPNKRHSLDGPPPGHKSRMLEAETVKRQRSNSASNSGIPTPKQDLQKKSNKTSLMKYTQKPKSTSSLGRIKPSSYQMNSPQAVTTSTRLSKTNFNPRALNDVKSPKPNRMKGITSAITGFVTGKGKKIAATDKENRVPY